MTNSEPPILILNLLGSPEIRLNGSSIKEKFQNKVLALLAYLAAELRPHTREHLMELFWPDVDTEVARSNLRVTLYRLRQCLGESRYLNSRRESLMLDPDDCQVDVAEFLSPLPPDVSIEQLESRAALYRGVFLEGVSMESSPDFTDWLALKQECCRRQVLALRDRLIAVYEKNGNFGKALHQAGCRLELDPWNESSYRKIMSLLALDGQRDAALAQYDACRNVLARELGSVPDRQTTELFDRIKAGKLGPGVSRRHPFVFLGPAVLATQNPSLNVLIVDDHLLFRVGLSLMLNELRPDVTVFEAASCEEALALPEPESGFNIILLDLKFPGMNGLDGLLLFRNRHPNTPVVLFSSDEETKVIQACHKRGAKGYISKGLDAHAIVAAIERVLAGGISFPFDMIGEV